MKEQVFLKPILWGLYIVPVTVLFYLQKTIFPFITLKIFSLFVFIEILALFWLWLLISYPQYRPRMSKLHWLILGFLALMSVSAIFGVNVSRSFWSVQERGIGLVALFHFYIFFLILNSFRKQINWTRYLHFLFWLSAVVASTAFIGRFAPEVFFTGSTDRPGGVLGNPAFMGSYLVITLFLGLWLAGSVKKNLYYKIALYAGVVFEVGAIFLGETRGTLMGLAVGLLAVLVYLGLRGYKAKRPLTQNIPLILLIALIAFGGSIWLTRQSSIWQSVPGLDRIVQISLADTTTNNRLIAWRGALGAFSERPITGWGSENFRYAFDARYDPTLLRSGFSETYWDKPHNIFLEILVTGGILGFGFFLAILLMAFYIVLRLSPKNFRPYGLGLLLAYIVQGMVTFDTFGSYLMLFFVFGLLHYFEKEAGQEKDSENYEPKSLRLILAIVGSVTILFGLVVNGKILYANTQYYDGLNYYVQEYPAEGFEAFNRAMDVNEPYAGAIKGEFLSVITQMIQQYAIPTNPERHIDEALARYDDAIKYDPDNYFTYSRLADARTVFFRVNKDYLNGVWDVVNKAIELSPNRQQNFYVTSKIKLLEGDIAGSLSEMQKAIDLDPLVAEPYLYQGMLRMQAGGDPAVALDEMRKALEMGRTPKNAQEARILGNYFGDAEDYDLAEYFYKTSLGFAPDDVETQAKLAIVYFYNGKLDQSRELFEQVLSTLPEEWYQTSYYSQLKPILDELGL